MAPARRLASARRLAGVLSKVVTRVRTSVQPSVTFGFKDATVTAKDTGRGTVWTTKTNDAGVYNLLRVPVGTYELRVSAQGFQTVAYPPFTLVLNQTARIDVQTRVGQVTETVEVTGAAPVLQTQSDEVLSLATMRAE